MRNITEITTDLEDSLKRLIDQIQEFTAENFNSKPSPEIWSGAEVCEHLYVLEYSVCKILTGETKENNRDPEQKIALMSQAMANFEQKVAAPDSMKPLGKARTQAEMIEKLEKVRQNLLEISQNPIYDLSLACTSAKHPYFGVLTRIEWIYMIVLHGNRHLQQMKGICAQVK